MPDAPTDRTRQKLTQAQGFAYSVDAMGRSQARGSIVVCSSLLGDRKVKSCRSGLPFRTVRNPGIAQRSLNAPADQGVQFLNLKLPMRVFQLNLPVDAMYCCVYQKVQSSVGSMLIAL